MEVNTRLELNCSCFSQVSAPNIVNVAIAWSQLKVCIVPVQREACMQDQEYTPRYSQPRGEKPRGQAHAAVDVVASLSKHTIRDVSHNKGAAQFALYYVLLLATLWP